MPPKKQDTNRVIPKTATKLSHSVEEPGAWIARLFWSPDGQELSVASKAREITIISLAPDSGGTAGARVRLRIPIEGSHIYTECWSPDGALLASSQSENGAVDLWDSNSGKLTTSLEIFPKVIEVPRDHGRPSVRAVAWSPDGKSLATGGDPGLVLWDVDDWQVVEALREQTGVISVAWSPDGRYLASTAYGNTLCIWDYASRRLMHRNNTHYGAGLAWSPDSRKVATAGTATTVCIWDAISGTPLKILEGHTDLIRGVSFSSDGLLLATRAGRHVGRSGRGITRGDPKILLWRTEDWENVGAIFEPPDWYLHAGISFAPTGYLLAVSANRDKSVHIWSLDAQKLLSRRGRRKSVYYRNAKVALVGDSGVGKSGLAIVLTDNKFVATSRLTVVEFAYLAERESD